MFQLVRAVGANGPGYPSSPGFRGLVPPGKLFFYKFGSFALETGAFLATWFALDALVEGARRLVSGRPASGQES